MDVDWSKTNQGRKYYNTQSAVDFAAAGISHVRIRIADKVDQELLEGLDRQIRDCLDNGIIPIIAYQADAFKNDPSDKNIEKVVAWWSEVTISTKIYLSLFLLFPLNNLLLWHINLLKIEL